MVILNADDGTIMATLPIGKGVDAAVFDPSTMEAFQRQSRFDADGGEGIDPATFEVEQNVQTNRRRTCALDSKLDRILPGDGGVSRPRQLSRPRKVVAAKAPADSRMFTILVVGRIKKVGPRVGKEEPGGRRVVLLRLSIRSSGHGLRREVQPEHSAIHVIHVHQLARRFQTCPAPAR